VSPRARWQVLTYGPGALLLAVGVLGFVATGAVWALALALAGAGSVAQGRSLVHLYRSAYFRGRGDQLRDLADGRWPNPDRMRPQPWEEPGTRPVDN
jgi:hypothetical protein